jgi:hypothetical protein
MGTAHSGLTGADLHEPKGAAAATTGQVYVADGAASGSFSALEGTEVASTGEAGGTKFLQEDGDNTCSWQTVEGATDIGSTGPVAAGYALRSDGSSGAAWTADEVYGGIGLYNNDAGAAIASIGTTPVKITVFDTNMPSNLVTPDHATDDDLTITVAGDYMVKCCMSFSTAAAGDAGTYQVRLRVNGSEGTGAQLLGTRRDMSGSSDVGSANFCGIATFAASDVLTVWVESDDGTLNDDIQVHEITLHVLLLKAS